MIECPHKDRDDFYERVSARWPDASMLHDFGPDFRCARLLHAALQDWAWRAFMSGVVDDEASCSVRYELGNVQAYGAVSWWQEMPADHYTDTQWVSDDT